MRKLTPVSKTRRAAVKSSKRPVVQKRQLSNQTASETKQDMTHDTTQRRDDE